MHLGVAIWKDKYNCNYNRARHLDLPRLPSLNLWQEKKKKKVVSIQLISNHLQMQLCDPQVKPLCLHLTSKTNTAQFGSMQTLEYKCVRGRSMVVERETHTKKQPEKWNPKQNKSCSRAIWMFTCWIFYQFCFYLSPPLPLSVLSMQQVLSYALGLRGAD